MSIDETSRLITPNIGSQSMLTPIVRMYLKMRLKTQSPAGGQVTSADWT